MKYKVIIIFLLFPVMAFSQEPYKKSFSFQQDFHDYGINVFEGKLVNFDSTLSQTFRIGYNRMLFNSVIFSTGISNGFLWNDRLETTRLSKNYAVGLDATTIFISNNGKLLRKNAPFAPYFTFGYQYYYINHLKKLGLKPNDFSLQYGIGFNLNLLKRSTFQIQSSLNQQLGGTFNTHFIHRIGFTQVIDLNGTNEEKNNIPNKELRDYDGDGIADINDQCPTLAGNAADFGCPKSYVNEMSKSITRLDSLEGLLLKLKNKMETLTNDMVTLNKLKKEQIKSSTIVEVVKPTATEIKPIETKKTPSIIQVIGNTKSTSEIEIVREKTGSYYVVTISALNEAYAVAEAQKIKLEYPNVKVISQDNGFFRTAIYCGTDKMEAIKLLDKITQNGIKQAWIAYY